MVFLVVKKKAHHRGTRSYTEKKHSVVLCGKKENPPQRYTELHREKALRGSLW
jgi:hypothetical protein